MAGAMATLEVLAFEFISRTVSVDGAKGGENLEVRTT